MSVNKFENEKFYDEVLAKRSSPWMVEALEILADGERHLREDVIRQLAKRVPPGVAWRHLEEARLNQLARRAKAELSPEKYEQWVANKENFMRKRGGSDEDNELIRRGQRAVIVTTLSSSKRIKREVVNGKVYLHRVPLAKRMLESMTNQMRNWSPDK